MSEIKEVIKFISAEHACFAFRFTKRVVHDTAVGDSITVDFEIATASKLLGFDKEGKFTDEEQFIYIDHNGNQVEEFDLATPLSAGSIFQPMYPEFDGNVAYVISFYSDCFLTANEFKAFSGILNSSFLTNVYVQI